MRIVRFAAVTALLLSVSLLHADTPPEPVIDSIAPTIAAYEGGTTVTIRGSLLRGDCAGCSEPIVYFGTTPAIVVSSTETELVVRTPAHRIGVSDVTVVNRLGAHSVARGAFAFRSDEDREMVLLPLLMKERDGGHGSRWKTRVIIDNNTPRIVVFAPLPFAMNPTSVVADPVMLVPQLDDPNPARILWVPRDHDDQIVFQLRALDAARRDETLGTEIPVVRERDMRVDIIRLLDVPTDRSFRVALRIYMMNVNKDTQQMFSVQLFAPDERTAPLANRIVVAEPLSGNNFETPTRPAYWQTFDLIAEMPEAVAETRVKIEIRPVNMLPVFPPPTVLFWAFATVTNNETQQLTVISPQ